MNFRYFLVGLLPVVMMVTFTCEKDNTPVDEPTTNLTSLMPSESLGWMADGEVEPYDFDGIFRYMNGAGEVYRMYSYREMAVQRMVHDGHPEITIEIFDMTTPSDAYGIFSHSRSTEQISPGQGASYETGLLCFWKHHYFVCVKATEETPESKDALFDIAGQIDNSIPLIGEKPAIIEMIPNAGLDSNSVKYFHLHTSLNYHYYLADRNILNLSDRTEAVFAKYQPDNQCLVLIRYKDKESADNAAASFREGFIPEADEHGFAQIEDDKWAAFETVGDYLLLVLDSSARESATELMDVTKKRFSDMEDDDG